MEQSKRIEWIDTVKFIGLYLMVLGHGGLTGNEDITQFIYSFHMPLFFILSGIFFRPGKLKKTAKALLIPYLTMNVLLLLYNALFAIINHTPLYDFCIQHIIPIFIGLGYKTETFTPVCTTMWFFYVMFLVHCLANVVVWKHKNSKVALQVFSLLSIMAFMMLKYYDIDTLFPLDSTLMSFPFFALGVMYADKLKEVWSLRRSIIVLLSSAIVLSIANHYNGRIDLDGADFGNNILLCYITGITGTLMIISVVKSLNTCNILNISKLNGGGYSAGSSVVVGLNLLFLDYIKRIFTIMKPDFHYNIVTGMLVAIFVMLLCYPIIKFMLKHCPILLGKDNR